MDFGAWGSKKALPPFCGAGLPYVVNMDGKGMTQSKAQQRYFGKKLGLYPTDPMTALEHDWIVETYYDWYDGGMLKEGWFEKAVPGLMKQMDKYKNRKCKFLLGDKMYVCDYVFGSWLTDLVANPEVKEKEKWDQVLEMYPWLKEYGKNIMEGLGPALSNRSRKSAM